MSGKSYLNNKKYHKYNYVDAFKFLVPGYIYDDDRDHSPKADDLADVVINSNINLANNIASVIDVSSIADTVSENLDNISGISPYFVKQNRLTDITTNDFETKVLNILDESFLDYETVESFSSFVTDSLIPTINLNNPASFSSTDTSNSHNYLISNLGWMYFLNTTGTLYDSSSFVADLIVNKLYKGKKVSTVDGVQGLMEYVWKNNLTSFYPSEYFASGTRGDLSGTQQLDKLKTWIEVLYSPLFSDESDFRVRDKFETFIEGGITTTRKTEDGPFARFIRALSFLAYDIDNLSESITTVYDLEDCPDQFLPLLAKLIGWDLFGSDPDKWRLQLRNATQIYKSVGTKKSIQFALNSVFPKDQFPIQNSLTELWESYVPFLIYYSLATESAFFKDFTTWTPQLAFDMGVSGYSLSSMDDNISRATDKIIEETYLKFPERFSIPNVEDGFHYRDYTHIVPPYEEYPYYVNVELTREMIDFIADRLACFGVRNQFALDVSGFLVDNGLEDSDDIRDGSWLLFTSGYQNPPNYSRMISESNADKIEYLSMWSGKSSHFKIVLDASAYDFTKRGLITADSGDALEIAFEMIRKFAPAHSIPLASLQVSGDFDTLILDDPNFLPLVLFNLEEANVAANNNYWLSGLSLNSYMRDVRTDGTVLSREETESSVSKRISTASMRSGGTATVAGDLERRSLRRRNLQNIMPFHGYYDRTGFNMPTTFEMDATLSGLPLGLVPSSTTFTPVSSHINLPPVWKQCEDLSSKNTYNGFDVSNTMAARGRAFFTSSVTNDRGKLSDIYAAMHRIQERAKVDKYQAEEGEEFVKRQVEQFRSLGVPEGDINILERFIDQLIYCPGWHWTNGANEKSNANEEGYDFPASVNDYYNFEFGRDLHNLYRIYVEQFDQHRLTPAEIELDGPNIISHTFGPLLYNHDFEKIVEGPFVTSSISNVIELKTGIDPFTKVKAYVADDPSDMFVENPELVFSSLVSGVEFIHTSGVEDGSVFSVFRVDSNARKEGDDPFMFDKTFILTKAGPDSIPRVRLDISKWDTSPNKSLDSNFLLPEHDYQLDLKALVADNTGRELGGRSVGIWIHTKPEDGQMWSFVPSSSPHTPGGEWLHSKPTGDWVQHSATLTRAELLQEYAHLYALPSETKLAVPPESPFQCLDVVAGEIISPVTKLREEDFENLQLKFNTRNRTLLEPVQYKQNVGNLHRKNQEYVIEIFLTPGVDRPDQFLLFDEVFVKDLTMKKMSERYVFGPKVNPLVELTPQSYKGIEYRSELSKEDLLAVFKYFNILTGKDRDASLASRYHVKTEAIMGNDGGSKLTYRYLVEMFPRVNFSVTKTLDLLPIDV